MIYLLHGINYSLSTTTGRLVRPLEAHGIKVHHFDQAAHVKKREFPEPWKPQSGDLVGYMVSGLIRSSSRNVSERTNLVLTVWP